VSFDLSFGGTQSLLAPAILGQPANQTILPGATAMFTVNAGGTAPAGLSVAFQWFANQGRDWVHADVTNAKTSDVGRCTKCSFPTESVRLCPLQERFAYKYPIPRRSPVPTDCSCARTAGLGCLPPRFLANDLDLENQTLVLTAVNSTSHLGATVTTSADRVNYQPLRISSQ
jgi:hypothetical protein